MNSISYSRKCFNSTVMAMIAGAVFTTYLPQASAEDNAPLKKGGFQLNVSPELEYSTVTINTSPDGSGGEILPSTIVLNLDGKIDFKWGNGFVERAGLFAGHCKRTDCGPIHKLLWFRSKYESESSDGGGLPENDWHFDHPIVTTPERMILPTDQIDLIQRCGELGEDEFYAQATVTLSANTKTDDVQLGTEFIGPHPFVPLDEVDFNGGDQSRHASFDYKVVCTQEPLEVAEDKPAAPEPGGNQALKFDHGSMQVDGIKMTLTTYSNAYSEPTPGTQCKMAHLRVTMDTNQEGLVSFRLWQQRGDGSVESEDVIVGAHHDGGLYKAVHERWIEVDETTNIQFNARDLVNETFNQETGWKDITLHCTGAGGGGLVAPESDSDDDAPSFVEFKGNFQLIDQAGAAGNNSCPRNAKALVWFNSPNDSNIHYSLDCGGLGNFSGVIQTEKIGNSHYRGAKLITYGLDETIEAGCTLRTVSPGQPRDHAQETKLFQCVSTNFDGGPGGLAVAPVPLPMPTPEPETPVVGTKILPVPLPQPKTPAGGSPILPAVCKGGKIRYGVCVCPNGKNLKQISSFEYICKSAKPKRTNPGKAEPKRTNPDQASPKRTNPAKPKLVCRNGKVKGGSCRCGSSATRVKLGANAYQCKPKAKRTNPKSAGSKRKNPDKAVPTRTNPSKSKPKRTNSKKTKLICHGGSVRGGKCRCASSTTRVKLGAKTYQCRPKAKRVNPKNSGAKRTNPSRKQIVCRGGRVQANQCRCAKGKKRMKTGANRYQCVRRTS